MSSAAATIAITLMAVIASGIQILVCLANTQGELADGFRRKYCGGFLKFGEKPS
jgi:hypothetical protein